MTITFTGDEAYDAIERKIRKVVEV